MIIMKTHSVDNSLKPLVIGMVACFFIPAFGWWHFRTKIISQHNAVRKLMNVWHFACVTLHVGIFALLVNRYPVHLW